MAAEMLSKVLDAEKSAEEILKAAHDEAGVIVDKAKSDAQALRLSMLEDAKKKVDEIELGIAERARFSAVEAQKRFSIEAERLRAVAENKQSDVIKTLVRAVTAD